MNRILVMDVESKEAAPYRRGDEPDREYYWPNPVPRSLQAWG